MKIAVLGGGHGCYAAAADLRQGTRCGCGGGTRRRRRWSRPASCWSTARAARGDDRHGHGGLGAALAGAELIVVPSPRSPRPTSPGDGAAPGDGQVVFLPPGTFGSFVMARSSASGLARRGGVGGDRHAALSGAQARPGEVRGDDPRGAPADRRLSGAAGRGSAGGDRRRPIPVRRLRRCPVGSADERRADDPSAADGDERGAAAALRALGHPRRRHAAGGARRHRPARPRAHRGARGARLRRAALPARRPLRRRPLDVRRRAQEARRLAATGASTSTCTRTAT